ncbi:MAG: RNHCP domain-containing protein [Armatimonadetes bacterium RBG_16_58_9]|nr:MAG: RNHCP domain-containing protein [Armatimonadetes bacterium RBG_16_58_9]
MSRQSENREFTCGHCGRRVVPLTNGSYRNHCPFCLHSKHVDTVPGDRMSDCGGLMEPVGLEHKSGKGWQIVHKCLRCGQRRVNKVAENTAQPDDIEALARLSTDSTTI